METNKYTDDEIKQLCLDNGKVIEQLNEFQRWRRGIGEYEWNEDPIKNKEYTLTPKQLGMIIDAAIKIIAETSGKKSETVKMTNDEYQEKAFSFASYGGNPMYAYFGLVEECAELIEKVTTTKCEKGLVIGELGDVLWMIAAICTENNMSINAIIDRSTNSFQSLNMSELLQKMEIVVGKLSGKMAKFIRKNNGVNPHEAKKTLNFDNLPLDEFKDCVRTSLSDIYSIIVEICDIYNVTVGYVMEKNIEKLTERKQKGVIVGEGDTTEQRIKNAK